MPTKDNFDMSDRKKFTQFFGQALKEIAQLRKMGSLGYLVAPELRHIIHQLYPEAPIVVLEKAHLKAVANGIADIENIFQHDTDLINVPDKKQLIDEQARELNLLRRFAKHEIDHIILIAGVGANHRHWITINAQRNEKGLIAITVADSLHPVADWVRDRSLIVNNILPFYLILQNGINSCKVLFTKDMQCELFEEYEPEELEVSGKSEHGHAEQAIAPIESNKLIFVIKALQMQHENILRLKNTLQYILDALRTGRINARNKLLMYLKIERFKRSSDILIHYLLKSRLTLNPDSLYQEKLAQLERLFFRDAKNPEDVDIYTTLTEILDTSIHNQKEEDDCVNNLRKIITKLNNMAPMIQELEEKLGNQSDADGQEFFNAITTKLNPEHISCILKHTSPQIRGLIGSIVENKPIASRMLLYGPPGNGKTTLPQAIAQICNRPFYIIRVASTGNSYQFSQEKDFAVINDFLKQHPNAIVLIDEIDCAFTDKKENDKAAKSLCDLIKNAKTQYPLAVIIATTNCDPQYQVDHSITRDESGNKPFPEALKSLFGQNTYKIDNPETAQRIDLIDYFAKQVAKRVTVHLSQEDKLELARITKKFSIRDIEAMFAQAEQQLMIPRGDAVIAQLTTDATTTDQVQQTSTYQQVIDKTVLTHARDVVYQSIITKKPWKKTVADFYHVTERTLHLISQIESCLHPCVQLYFRRVDKAQHAQELVTAAENQAKLHNNQKGAIPVKAKDGKIQEQEQGCITQ
jgi:DNA polymerase III delta prime subunit